jgi:hypothetical protein
MNETRFRDARWIRKPLLPIEMIGWIIGLLCATILFGSLRLFSPSSSNAVADLDGLSAYVLKTVLMTIGMSTIGIAIFVTRRRFGARAAPVVVNSDSLSFRGKSNAFSDIRSIRYTVKEAIDNMQAGHSTSTVDTLLVIDHATGSLALMALGSSVVDIDQALTPVETANPDVALIPFPATKNPFSK